jgi:hypothetical protein
MQMISPELAVHLGRTNIFLCVVLGFLLFWGLQKRYESGFQDGFWVCVSGMGEVAQLEEH